MLAGALPNGEPQIEGAGLTVTEIISLINIGGFLKSVADALDILVDEIREARNTNSDHPSVNES